MELYNVSPLLRIGLNASRGGIGGRVGIAGSVGVADTEVVDGLAVARAVTCGVPAADPQAVARIATSPTAASHLDEVNRGLERIVPMLDLDCIYNLPVAYRDERLVDECLDVVERSDVALVDDTEAEKVPLVDRERRATLH